MDNSPVIPKQDGRTIIEVNRTIDTAGALIPTPARLRIRRPEDFPADLRVYVDVARRLASPLLSGPPLCDELVAFVQHLLTEEEASVMRHLRPMWGRRAEAVARAAHRPVDEVEPVLKRLADVKRCIGAAGDGHARKYQLMPLMPGIFEMVLIGVAPEAFNAWHQRFIELFEALYSSGFLRDYQGTQPAVRFLPQAAVAGVQPTAMPASHFEAVAERFKTFAVGQCQCRMAMNAMGKGCGRALGNCTLLGTWAEKAIKGGWVRQVSRSEILEIKREAEASGLVSWVLNVDSRDGQASCSCCGCCCHAMKMINDFNIPGWFAPPRLRPRFDEVRCTGCGACARRCPMRALVMQGTGKRPAYLRERCVGCGLCALACPKKGVEMREVAYQRLPFANWPSMMARSLPAQLRVAWRVWRKRARETRE
ncbi:MAG TPA: 4Fe-4S dicluster domain-containing protein [Tepidisphaeraceae bacterium]|nr:4Fe-4S dicluster domain-containing protein [Tepidisphaeraceae bacterium]